MNDTPRDIDEIQPIVAMKQASQVTEINTKPPLYNTRNMESHSKTMDDITGIQLKQVASLHNQPLRQNETPISHEDGVSQIRSSTGLL